MEIARSTTLFRATWKVRYHT